MKINAWLGVFVFCGITALAVTTDLPSFIDLASLLMVIGGASGFVLCSNGTLFSDSRLEAASEGAVISGWLGSLYGAVMISANVSDFDALGPAISVALLTVTYGYFFKAVIRLVLLSRQTD